MSGSNTSVDSNKRHERDWSESVPPVEDPLVPSEDVPDVMEIVDDDNQKDQNKQDDSFTTVKRRRRVKKGKKVGSKEPKDERQARSYEVSDSDILLYNTKHRVSDEMFSHYLRKRIGYECKKKNKRLSKKEVKNLFSPVRSLCLELLAQVKVKKLLNREKKVVITSIQKSTSSNISWSDIVKGKKVVPGTEKDIHLAAKNDKIKKQAEEIRRLKDIVKKRDDEIKTLTVRYNNLADRVLVLERNEVSRKTRDPYADLKKLAAKGSLFCNECLPPSAFIYKKPVLTPAPAKDCGLNKMCDNCKSVKVYVSAGTSIPLFSYHHNKKVFFTYPAGHIVLNNAKSVINRNVKNVMTPKVRNVLSSRLNSDGTLESVVFGSLMNTAMKINPFAPSLESVKSFLQYVHTLDQGSGLDLVFNLMLRNNLFLINDILPACIESGLAPPSN